MNIESDYLTDDEKDIKKFFEQIGHKVPDGESYTDYALKWVEESLKSGYFDKKRKQSYIEYSSNNSGGRWWLKDKDWTNLEKAGWIVQWSDWAVVYNSDGIHDAISERGAPIYMPQVFPFTDFFEQYNKKSEPSIKGVWYPLAKKGNKYLGALAVDAVNVNYSLKMAIAEFEDITGQDSKAEGCNCCGEPHNFYDHRDK